MEDEPDEAPPSPPKPESQAGGRRASDHEPKPKEKEGWVPRPPRIETSADFIVIVFACTVAFILVALTIGIIISAFKGNDIKAYFAVITSIMTSIISALVGYLAGRSSGPPEPPPPAP